MSKNSKATIDVQGTAVTVVSRASDDYISLTDIAKHKEPNRSDHVIQNWMRNRNSIEFLGVWERLNNAYPVCCPKDDPMLNFRHGPSWFSDDTPRISAGIS